MKLTTTFSIPRSPYPIRAENQILCIGSCFAENMGNRLADLPLKVSSQAMGTLFHPLNILRSLQPQELKAEELYKQGDNFVHPDFHSQFMGAESTSFLAQLNTLKTNTLEFLKASQFLVITWGTAYYYEDKVLGRAIANCHKQLPARFTKHLSSVEEICAVYEEFLRKRPFLKVIISVSPVRHTRDGMPENSVSKAILRLAADQLAQKFPEQVSYFPAYEIMMDELRDYRFYQADLIHPTDQAVNYIYERFKITHFDDSMLEIAKRWQEIHNTLQHRPHPLQNAQHVEVLKRLRKEVEKDQSGIDSSKLLAKIDQQILALS